MYVYDIETYPNLLLVCVIAGKDRWQFECSPYRNDWFNLMGFLGQLRLGGERLVGFNNDGFDYPVLHYLLHLNLTQSNGVEIAQLAYRRAMEIINTPWNDRFTNKIHLTEQFVRQTDLFLLNHYDNPNRSTSLKLIEFNLRAANVQELPIAVGTELNQADIGIVTEYCWNDVINTQRFAEKCGDAIELRQDLSREYQRDMTNYSNSKIGSEILISRLEKAGIDCYEWVNRKRRPRQTHRDVIAVKDVIFPYVYFTTPDLVDFLERLRGMSITETRKTNDSEFNDLTVTHEGFEFVYGMGGIHGSLESVIVESDETHMILDIDVTSFYPSLAIVNRLYPAHLGELFCTIYQEIKNERLQYKKGTAKNAALKESLNASYGNSNNDYSPLKDPQYTMATTINGQLLLIMLAEWLMGWADLEMIQVNTDGLTVRFPRGGESWVRDVCRRWVEYTKLDLEYAQYTMMAIRDVNNYLAVKTDGSVKRKGAYNYKMEWHQNHSFLVVPKVAEKVLIEGAPIRETLESWSDRMDFMGRTKVPKNSKLMYCTPDGEDQVQNVSRYYVSIGGGSLVKVMPPLRHKGQTEDRRIGIHTGRTVRIANNLWDFNWLGQIDFDFYEKEVQKLVMGLR